MIDHEITLQNNADNLVRREVHLCLSSMVSALASGYSALDSSTADLSNLAEQAAELCGSKPDYEEAARQAGWTHGGPGTLWTIADGRDDGFTADTAEEACELDGLDPYKWEVYEHWAVSQSLADDLIRHGERVDTDFAGLCVWARTTTGQAISMDGVIRKITAEIHAEVAA